MKEWVAYAVTIPVAWLFALYIRMQNSLSKAYTCIDNRYTKAETHEYVGLRQQVLIERLDHLKEEVSEIKSLLKDLAKGSK